MSNIELNMCKENADSSNYLKIFDLENLCIKNIKTICLIGIGDINVLDQIFSLFKNKKIKIDLITESNIISFLKLQNELLGVYNNIKFKTLDINKIGTNLKDCFTMEYDLVIGNPPYKRDLHLKILDEVYKHVKEGGEIVWLAPITRLTDIRNIYDNLSIKKFNEYNYIFKNIKFLKKLTRNQMENIFVNISPVNQIGILKILKNSKNLEQIYADKFLNLSNESKLKIKNIIKKIILNNIEKKNLNKTKICLKLPLFGGHSGKYDKFFIFNRNYKKAVDSTTKSNVILYFKTEQERFDFWKFWTSDFGYFLISLWKIDTNVYPKYIPYLWFETEEEAKKFFDITDDEIAEIAKVTMTNDK